MTPLNKIWRFVTQVFTLLTVKNCSLLKMFNNIDVVPSGQGTTTSTCTQITNEKEVIVIIWLNRV